MNLSSSSCQIGARESPLNENHTDCCLKTTSSISQIEVPGSKSTTNSAKSGRRPPSRARHGTRKSGPLLSDHDTTDFRSEFGTEFDAIAILEEDTTRYLVSRTGVNPKTREPWDPTWESKGDTSRNLIDDWEQLKLVGKPKSSRIGIRSAVSMIFFLAHLNTFLSPKTSMIGYSQIS